MGYNNRNGNVFAMLFGGVALVGVLGAATMQMIRGPLTTAVNVNRTTTADTQMMTGAQLIMTTSAGQAKDGDCDDDGRVEPLPYVDAGPRPGGDGGGLVPSAVGMSRTDPWGTNYGYCAWDHGSVRNKCGDGRNLLKGAPLENKGATAIALISAGKDGKFQTKCQSFSTADSNDNNELDGNEKLLVRDSGSDDIIYSRTYSEAAKGSGGLWELRSGTSGVVETDKQASLGDADAATNFNQFGDGVLFANEGVVLGEEDTSSDPP